MDDLVSIEGSITLSEGNLVFSVPLSAGGSRLAEVAEELGETDGDSFHLIIPPRLADKLNLSPGSLVVVESRAGKLSITPSPDDAHRHSQSSWGRFLLLTFAMFVLGVAFMLNFNRVDRDLSEFAFLTAAGLGGLGFALWVLAGLVMMTAQRHHRLPGAPAEPDLWPFLHPTAWYDSSAHTLVRRARHMSLLGLVTLALSMFIIFAG